MPCEETVSTFSIDLAKFGQKAVDNAEKIVRKIGFDMHSRIVQRMPKDTGRATANQQISINSLPSGSVLEFDKSGNATISNGGAALARFKLGDTIFLYNNVEYILALEYGHSKQAPAGMFRITFEEVVQHLGAA
jgi:hypothetical protein